MKKVILLGLAVLLTAAMVTAEDLGNGLSLSGGVKTGFLAKNSDYSGKLNGIDPSKEYPLTLYFASADSDAYNGEGWLSFNYEQKTTPVHWGLNLGMWAHDGLTSWNDTVHLGDHYLWVNFFDDKLQVKGGQGGGTPITTGGWLGADWLGYTGVRVFWVDPIGISAGINFPDPGSGGIKPVNYLSTIMFGAKYEDPVKKLYWITLMWDNNPIYDDSEADFDGGLHRSQEILDNPIGVSGNAAFGIGVNNIFGGKGLISLDGIISNIGENDKTSKHGAENYKISQLKSIFALKMGYPITPSLTVELKGKYTLSNGDNADCTGSDVWGQLQIEPYIGFQALPNVKAQITVNFTHYVNSYYLAADRPDFNVGQVPMYESVKDYASTYQLAVKPSIVFSIAGLSTTLGYNGDFSRDHLENKIFVDARWSF